MRQIQLPPLRQGETYVGVTGDAYGNLHHVILLPGDSDDATWQGQLDWAKAQGGDLPTRVEQAMLWASCREQLRKDWYWSNETHHSDSSCAWYQYFNFGSQLITHKSAACRAVAIRRLPL